VCVSRAHGCVCVEDVCGGGGLCVQVDEDS